MAAPPASVALANDSSNPCFGCGPDHPTGLRLSFRREGDAVTTAWLASGRYQGFPNVLHSGMLYLILLETANWTLYGILGRIGVPVRTSALEAKRWIRTGEKLTFTGRVAESGETGAKVKIEAADAQGNVLAVLEREYDLPGKAAFLERMGYRALPPALEGTVPD